MKRLLLIFGILLLLLAGCADDSGSSNDSSDDEDTEETTDTTEDEEEEVALDDWIDDVDAICEDYDEQFDEIEEPDVGDYETLLDAATEAQELNEEQLAEIEEVGLPDEETETVEEALELLDEQVGLYDDLIEAAEDEDDDAIEEVFGSFADIDEQLSELADEIGLEVCGVGGEGEEDPGSLGGPDGSGSSDTTDDTDDTGTDDGSAGGPMQGGSDLAAIEAQIEADYTAQLGLAIDVTCEPVDLATATSFECEGIDEELDVLTIQVTSEPGGYRWEVTAVNGVSG